MEWDFRIDIEFDPIHGSVIITDETDGESIIFGARHLDDVIDTLRQIRQEYELMKEAGDATKDSNSL